MRGLAGEQRVAQRGARRRGELGGKRLGQRLGLALQQEPEVLHRADPHEALVAAAAVERDRRRAAARGAPHEALRQLSPLDRRPPRPSAHSSIPSSNRWRGSPYTSPRYPCLLTASAYTL